MHKEFPRMSMPSEIARWSLPVKGLYKVNFDRAIFEDQACARLGVVIRDSARLIIGALSQKIRLPSSAVMVEALVASRAISFAREISILRVVVEDWKVILCKLSRPSIIQNPPRLLLGISLMRLNCSLLFYLVVVLFMLGVRVIS